MSIKFTSRVLEMPLPPVQKLVLLVLADAANEDGVSWPGLQYVADRASVSVRTVQRVLADTESQGLLRRQPRFRRDRSRTSSEYLLFPGSSGGDKLTPPLAVGEQDGVSAMAVVDDAAVTLTTIEPSENNNHHHNHGVVGLIFPRGLSQSVRDASARLLITLPKEDAQVLLDELSGRMASGGVRSSPVAYLRSLVSRFKAGDFVPEVAHRVAEQRIQRIKEREEFATEMPAKKMSPDAAKAQIAELKKAIKRGGRS